jgi:8-hydroxy-5-deazaflavin:NADPH oxidoreductase
MNTATNKTKVAIIGLGNIGSAIASNLIKGQHPIMLASRELEKSLAFADKLGSMAIAKETTEAIQEADVVIPALSFGNLKDFFKTYSNALEGKIIVDVSNPIAADGKGGFKKIIGENESAANSLLAYIPKSAKLVKAFGTLGAGSLLGEAFSQPEQKVLFYASDNTNSNPMIEELIHSSGFDAWHIGGLDKAIQIEVFGELHQFGALGKTVTLAEVKGKVLQS